MKTSQARLVSHQNIIECWSWGWGYVRTKKRPIDRHLLRAARKPMPGFSWSTCNHNERGVIKHLRPVRTASRACGRLTGPARPRSTAVR